MFETVLVVLGSSFSKGYHFSYRMYPFSLRFSHVSSGIEKVNIFVLFLYVLGKDNY